MEQDRLGKLAQILSDKVEEGLEELPKLSVKTEEFTICLNNTLSSFDLVNKLVYKPAPKTNVTPIQKPNTEE